MDRRSFIVALASIAALPELARAADEKDVIAGEVFSAGEEHSGRSGEYLFFQLFNPAGSGRLVLLDRAVITPDSDILVGLRTWSTDGPVGDLIPPCNLLIGGAGPKAGMRCGYYAKVRGGQHGFYKLHGGAPYTLRTDGPLAALRPGKGVVVFMESAGVGATCNFEWTERPV
jgi:hypothetical protein